MSGGGDRLPREADETYATYCPDCECTCFEGDEGFDYENCIECGSENVYEVPA